VLLEEEKNGGTSGLTREANATQKIARRLVSFSASKEIFF